MTSKWHLNIRYSDFSLKVSTVHRVHRHPWKFVKLKEKCKVLNVFESRHRLAWVIKVLECMYFVHKCNLKSFDNVCHYWSTAKKRGVPKFKPLFLFKCCLWSSVKCANSHYTNTQCFNSYVMGVWIWGIWPGKSLNYMFKRVYEPWIHQSPWFTDWERCSFKSLCTQLRCDSSVSCMHNRAVSMW